MFSGNKNKTKELIRSTERQNRSVQRDLTKEQRDLDREEKRLIAEIKKRAAVGDKTSCNVLATQLLKVRQQRGRIIAAGSRMSAVASQQKMASSTIAMGNALATTSTIMGRMNKEMDVAGLSKTLQNFDRMQSEMEMREEMMDDVFSDDVEDEETDKVVEQVLDEIGLDIFGQLSKAPVPSSSLATSSKKRDDDEELTRIQAQLDQLRS